MRNLMRICTPIRPSSNSAATASRAAWRVGSAAQADGVAATHDDGGQSTTQNTPCSLHADANLQAGGGRRSASRELAGLPRGGGAAGAP